MSPVRLLCLHGYRQNGEIFREKTGSLRKILKKVSAEFVFIDAPHRIENDESSNREEERGWWFSSEDSNYDPLIKTSCDRGFEESIQFVSDFIEQQEMPFDGILAFSQGAAFLTLLLSRFSSSKIPVKFVILVAGFQSGQQQHESFYENLRIEIPSLHVFGLNDRVIPFEMSKTLAEKYFLNGKVFIHDAGHFIPTSSQAKEIYLEFIQTFS